MKRTRARAGVVATMASALLLAAGGPAGSATTPSWNHDPADPVAGPPAWGGIDAGFEACSSGASQSPVNIGRAAPAALPTLYGRYPSLPVAVENTGHVIEVPFGADGGGSLRMGADTYRLVQYHFHAPSEHTVKGRRFDLEAHLVHRSDLTGRLLVVAVLLDEGRHRAGLVESVLSSAPETAGEEQDLAGRSSAADLIPGNQGAGRHGSRERVKLDRYVTYAGSLTTPPCSEGVTWIVLERTDRVSPRSVDRLHDVIAEFPGYHGFADNNRPTQPLNGRTLTRSHR